MSRTTHTEVTKDYDVKFGTAEDDLKDGDVFQRPVIEGRAERERELLRKIDLRMMPLMMLICEKPNPQTRRGSTVNDSTFFLPRYVVSNRSIPKMS